MSWSVSAGFSTPCSDSLIKTVLGYLAASIRGPCIYNCINRLTLCLISWRTQHATHSAAGSSPSVIHSNLFTNHNRKRKVLARRAVILTRRRDPCAKMSGPPFLNWTVGHSAVFSQVASSSACHGVLGSCLPKKQSSGTGTGRSQQWHKLGCWKPSYITRKGRPDLQSVIGRCSYMCQVCDS